jgi:ferredoxin
MFGPELVDAFRDFKRIWDPEGRMNPGRIVDPDPIVADLRLAGGRPGRREATTLRFPEDGGDLSRAVLRCVGVGKCRSLEGGSMCPSFRVTEEEEHSTRGTGPPPLRDAAGETIPAGWRSEEVRRALHLCLACKACKTECPVGVDMASYKAEFLSHFYRGRRRPRQASFFGRVRPLGPLGLGGSGGGERRDPETPGLSALAASGGRDRAGAPGFHVLARRPFSPGSGAAGPAGKPRASPPLARHRSQLLRAVDRPLGGGSP